MKKPIIKKTAVLFLALCFMTACGWTGAESKTLEGKPYPNSNLYGNWPDQRPGPEESFDLYVNYDAYQEALANGAEEDVILLTRAERTVREQILELCRGSAQTDTETEILRILYGTISDTQTREQEGMAPLMDRVDRAV